MVIDLADTSLDDDGLIIKANDDSSAADELIRFEDADRDAQIHNFLEIGVCI
ncbi:hypothetical protein D1872_282610 [compost metagenome]